MSSFLLLVIPLNLSSPSGLLVEFNFEGLFKARKGYFLAELLLALALKKEPRRI